MIDLVACGVAYLFWKSLCGVFKKNKASHTDMQFVTKVEQKYQMFRLSVKNKQMLTLNIKI